MPVDPQPDRSYLICTTPRSGSTLLCELLTDTGIAGRPAEYFQRLRSTGRPMMPGDYLAGVAPEIVPPAAEGDLSEHALYDPGRFRDFDEYIRWVLSRGTTANGVFAAKIMWVYMSGLVDGLSTVPRRREAMGPDELLARAFPGLRYVWLRRMDKVRQAVSLWRAIQTWHWREDAAPDSPNSEAAQLRYSYEAIDHLRRRLVSADRAWELYFEGTGANPLTVGYEDFTEDMHGTVTAILRHVGVDHPRDAGYAAPRTARQSDQISEGWVARFRAEFAGRVPAVS